MGVGVGVVTLLPVLRTAGVTPLSGLGTVIPLPILGSKIILGSPIKPIKLLGVTEDPLEIISNPCHSESNAAPPKYLGI